MSSDEVREVIASLREGDEVEADYAGEHEGEFTVRGRVWVSPYSKTLAVGDRVVASATAVRVIKRAPLPEPPFGTPVWWDGKWWYKPPAQDVYLSLGWNGQARYWSDMPGAIPAATPGGDE